MIVGKAIYYLLTNATDVTDIVSTRIYPEIAQQDAGLPYIVYNVANNEPTDTKPEPSKLDTAQVEVNIYSDSYTECIDLAVAVRAALDRVKGTYAGVNVQSIQYLNEIIDFDEPQRAYNISADYDVRISRTDFEIAQGSPITGVQLGELSDVDVDGVTNGQLIAYNSTSGNWEAADDAGGANELSDLSDASVSLPSDGEVLIYSGGEFVNDNIAISNVTNLQSELDATPDSLDDLTDVKIVGTPQAGEALVYSSGFWQRGTAGASTLGELDDVNTTGAGVGSTITFNGSTWDISGAGLPSDDIYYHNRYSTEAETLRAGATATVELYYTAQADGDGIAESAESDTATTGYDIRRKLYYSEAAQADCDSGTWVQFADIADDTTFASAKATLLAYLKERTGGTVPISLKMTWEEVAEAPSFTGLLNESYGSGAAAAYSVRRLNGNYTGAAIQVERSSDNTTQDIGFDSNGDLDESALTTFCTGTTGKVRTWYDQSQTGGTGSGNDAVQTDHANQPTIYTGGAIVKENGRVAFNSTSGASGFSAAVSGASAAYLFTVASSQNSATNMILASSGNTWLLPAKDGSATTAAANIGVNNLYLSGSSYSFVNWGQMFDDTTIRQLIVSDINNSAWTTLDFGWTANTSYGMYQMQEAIFYDSDKSTDRTSIESNIGDYFTQNTPLLDTYTGAAAAYSLRKLSSSYSGSAIRVRRASDNTEQDIGFNVFGELDTVSLASFCSGTNGFVKTWYDQSGSANDVSQSTTSKQPKIYDSSTGTVIDNGKPAVDFIDATQYFESSVNLSQPITSFSVGNIDSADVYQGILGGSDNKRGPSVRPGPVLGIYTGTVLASTTSFPTAQSLFGSLHNGSSSNVVLNGTIETTGNAGTDGFTSLQVGGYNSGGGDGSWIGLVQEVVLYESDQSSNRTNIEDNINTFYSIY